jgi:hypothetical protein
MVWFHAEAMTTQRKIQISKDLSFPQGDGDNGDGEQRTTRDGGLGCVAFRNVFDIHLMTARVH